MEADWSKGSTHYNYFEAKKASGKAGAEVVDLLLWLHEEFGLRYEDVHLIGHSLGSQVAGAVGKVFKSPKIGRITGRITSQDERNKNPLLALLFLHLFYSLCRIRPCSARLQPTESR